MGQRQGFSGWLVPVTQRLASDYGSMATLNEFFRLCELAGPRNAILHLMQLSVFEQLANSIKAQPIRLVTADGIEFEVDNALFINTVKSSLYSVWNWQNLADLLAFTEAGAPPAITAEHYTALLNDLTASDPAPVPFDNNP